MSLKPSSRLGRYEVRSLLGAGGMGEVYRAFDHDLEREVAIKVLGEDAEEGSERVRRFVQEARAASALSHPNVATVHEIGTQGGLRFIAMELVPGVPLRARLREGQLSISDTLALATQIGAGLAAAHEAGIIHRDIKPENIMVRPDGYAKILDFGLAKLREVRDDASTALRTATGVTMGTLNYMSPEQLSGEAVTPASDVFSFGVVLYEMISGRRPFQGTTATEVATAILTKTPQPLDAPPKLAAAVMKAIEKEPGDRYPTAAEMLDDLRHITGAPVYEQPRMPRSRKPLIAAIAVLLIAIAGVAVWMSARARERHLALESIATAERLLKERNFPGAYETAAAAIEILPNDERLREVIAASSTRVVFESDPPGATVFLDRFSPPSDRMTMGVTPMTIVNLPLADYVVTFEKAGFTPAVRPLPKQPVILRGEVTPVRPGSVSAKLIESGRVPPEMVKVDGGEYTLVGWQRMSDRTVKLDDYLIDRFEVSNRDYEAFVRDGGYRRAELWKTLSFEEVEKNFRDKTGLPAPRNWSGGAPPAGRETHPVTGVTWHEASAYALWKGKRLPTVYQWEKAARYPEERGSARTFPWGLLGEGIDSSERMNFNAKGTLPVDGMPFGIGPYGAHHMAGNVSEWTRNPLTPGYAVRGGNWSDALYSFGRTSAFPAMYAGEEIGFRCVKPLEGDAADQGEFALTPSGFIPEYEPVSDEDFKAILARYEYQRTPLVSRVVERIDQGDWTRERIEYEVDGRTVPAYLYLPKNFKRPLQVVHFSPAGDVYIGWRSLPQSVEVSLGPIIRGGRAIFAVVIQGFIGRPIPAGYERPDSRSLEFVDHTVREVVEMRRGFDYLESRPDIDASRVAYFGMSAGAGTGLVITGVEKRYRSVLFIGTHIRPSEVTDTPAANRINFAPRIKPPKMMLQGRYDESAPLESGARPLFNLMREPKVLEVFEGGHVPPQTIQIPAMTKWFDETLGKVQ